MRKKTKQNLVLWKISKTDQRALKLVKSLKGHITKFTEQRLLWITIVNNNDKFLERHTIKTDSRRNRKS